jgi:diguanylate cyclase (GGDEF)-like protein
MLSSSKKKGTIAILLYFAVYTVVTVQHYQFWGDFLSALGGSVATLVLIHTWKTEIKKEMRNLWALLIFAIGCHVTGDLIWFASRWVLKVDPFAWSWLSLVYGGTNVFLVLYTLQITRQRVEKWWLVQYGLDAVAVTYFTMTFLWLVFFRGSWQAAPLLREMGLTFSIFMLLDAVVLVGVSTNALAMRREEFQLWKTLLALGCFFYVIVDLIWAYLSLYQRYTPNSPVDAAYMASLLLFAMGALYYHPHTEQGKIHEIRAEQRLFRWIRMGYALLNPFVLLTLGSPDLGMLLNNIFFAVIYISMSGYVQASLRNEVLLRHGQQVLEERVRQRTKDLEESKRKYQELSSHDELTNLGNRRFFMEQLQNYIEQREEGEQIALLFLDLDRFKTINDTYGHDVGDQVLIEVADRLKKCCHNQGSIARFSGDEFVCLTKGTWEARQAIEMAEMMLDKCCKGLVVGEQIFSITASIGISFYPQDAKTANQLLKNADMAMYQAKKQGNNQIVCSNPDLNRELDRRNHIEMSLRNIDPDKEFSLCYQPLISLGSGELLGMEALLRWKHPRDGMISPNEFIPLAEETNDILAIGGWVLDKAFQQLALWNQRGGLDLRMSINVSPKQWEYHDFSRSVREKMEKYQLQSQWLELEITERVAMEGGVATEQLLHDLQSLGIAVAIDDFSTGYSNLMALKDFSFGTIKIAKPLIDNIIHDEFDRQVVQSVINLAKTIKIRTIAEGVEREGQVQILTAMGCDGIQGFYFSHPLPAEEFYQQYISPLQARKERVGALES